MSEQKKIGVHTAQLATVITYCKAWGRYVNPDEKELPKLSRNKPGVFILFMTNKSAPAIPLEENPEKKVDIFLDDFDRQITGLPLELSTILRIEHQFAGTSAQKYAALSDVLKSAQIEPCNVTRFKYDQLLNAAHCRLTERFFGGFDVDA